MTAHPIASREAWLAARRALLEAEKALTRQSDELATRRQALPWVRVTKPYAFDTGDGPSTLSDLFRGRSQLLVYHFMFGPDYTAGCPSCSIIADGFDHIAVHLAQHDLMLWAVSRAPLSKLLAFRERMRWSFPWASSVPSDFNADFSVFFTEREQREGIEYNFRPEPGYVPQPGEPSGPEAEFAQICGTDKATYVRERPGMSAFALQDGRVFHTYSAYARGLDALWGSYQWLDRAPSGRNESGVWWKRRDEYETSPLA